VGITTPLIAQVPQAFADQIGADGHSANAPRAIQQVKQLVAQD